MSTAKAVDGEALDQVDLFDQKRVQLESLVARSQRISIRIKRSRYIGPLDEHEPAVLPEQFGQVSVVGSDLLFEVAHDGPPSTDPHCPARRGQYS